MPRIIHIFVTHFNIESNLPGITELQLYMIYLKGYLLVSLEMFLADIFTNEIFSRQN